MKISGYFVMLVAALLAVTAIPGSHGDGFVACGNDVECLSSLYERAIMASSTQGQVMTAASSSAETTVTVDTYTTVPCSDETDITASTTTLSKHTTSTDFLTVTVTSASSIASGLVTSGASSLTYASISSTAAASTIASTLGTVAFSSATTLSTVATLSTGTSSSTSTLIIIPFFSTSVNSEAISGSTVSIGSVDSTSVTTDMAYISPSYVPGPSTAPPAYSGIAGFSTTSSVDAISATSISSPSAAVTVITQPVIPVAASTSAGISTLTTCSTSTRTTIINVAYNPSYVSPNYAGALSSVLASISLISEQYYSTTPVATASTMVSLTSPSTGEEACTALSTVWVTITGTATPISVSSAAASVPADSLESQSETSSGVGNGPSTLASTGAIFGTDSALTTLTSTTPVPLMATESASNGNSVVQSLIINTTASNVSHAPSTLAAPTSSTNGIGVSGITNSMAPAVLGENHFNMALVMCVVGAILMFAI